MRRSHLLVKNPGPEVTHATCARTPWVRKNRVSSLHERRGCQALCPLGRRLLEQAQFALGRETVTCLEDSW